MSINPVDIALEWTTVFVYVFISLVLPPLLKINHMHSSLLSVVLFPIIYAHSSESGDCYCLLCNLHYLFVVLSSNTSVVTVSAFHPVALYSIRYLAQPFSSNNGLLSEVVNSGNSSSMLFSSMAFQVTSGEFTLVWC